ncbi:hypothetical protein SLE2022_361220 [Rubroshorea leprosula]
MASSPKDSPSQDTPSSPPAAPPPSKDSPSPPPPKSNSSPSNSSPAPPDNDNSPPSSTASRSPPPPNSKDSDDSSFGDYNAPPPPKKHSSKDKSSNDDDISPSPKSSKSSKNSSDGDSSSDTKVIIGVVVGAALLLAVLILFITRCLRQKKKKKKNHYYEYADPDAKGSQQYYMGPQQAQWQNSPVPDHVVKLPQAPVGMGGSPAMGWGAPPQIQVPVSSGEMSSSFSGGPHRPPLPPPSPGIALGFNKSTFTYEELAAATNGFSDANLLGQGGFGYVHKGVLPNGKVVAVKSLKIGSGQGEREFQAEVEIISRVHHRHLVSLVGYCIAGGQRMLVYEFVPNKTLEYHLHGKGLPVMDFSTRLRIALGSAKGLAYLHEDCHPRIIHRDIKSANILLETNFEAMVADFGLAKLSSDNYTHVSTRVMGTFGYLAPEYASSGKLSEKSDVFSFGVMLLELITGKPPVDPSNAMEDSLVDWARPLLVQAQGDGNYDQLADPRLERNYNHNEMARMAACAAASIRHSARKRPKMSQIVRALEGDSSLDDLNEGVKPGQSTAFSSIAGSSSDYSQSTYHADLQRFKQLALSSQELNSSDYGTSSNDSRDMTPRQKANM